MYSTNIGLDTKFVQCCMHDHDDGGLCNSDTAAGCYNHSNPLTAVTCQAP